MPYVTEEDKARLNPMIEHLAEEIYEIAGKHIDPDKAVAQMGGRLNYCVTKLALRVLDWAGGGDSYSKFRAILGDLDAAKLEFYRRRIAPYEDRKRAENGDVY